MNDENLIPNSKRTPSELREITKKGGIASGVARRTRKAVKQAVLDALYSAAPSGGTEMEAGIAATIKRWKETGDPKCFDILMIYAGQSPENKRKDTELKLKREELAWRKEQSEKQSDTEGQAAAIRARAAVIERAKQEVNGNNGSTAL